MQELVTLRKEAYRAKYGKEPNKYFESEFKVKKPKTAAQLESLVSEYIHRRGGICTKVSVTGRPIVTNHTSTNVLGKTTVHKDVTYIPGTTKKGTSDLIATIYGRTVYIEVKLGKDRQSIDQKAFEKFVTERGSKYVIIKELQDVVQMFKSITVRYEAIT